MKKLIILGDSILKGVTVSDETERYRICLQKYEELATNGVDVRNYSKMGATIEYGERVLMEELSGNEDECIVLFEYGGNDCDYKWKDISENPVCSHKCRTAPSVFKSKYKACVEYALSKGAKVLISNLPPIDSDRFTSWVSRGLNYDVILEWLGDKNVIYRWQENYSHIVEELAKSEGVKLIDIRSAFLNANNIGKLISKDGIHPTEEGHSIINKTVTKAVLASF